MPNKIIKYKVALLFSLLFACEYSGSNLTQIGELELDWEIVAVNDNAMTPGSMYGDIGYYRYGRPENLVVWNGVMYLTLYRGGDLSMNTGICALDLDGNVIWSTNNESMPCNSIDCICLTDSCLIAYGQDDIHQIREYSLASGELLSVIDVDFPTQTGALGRSCWDIASWQGSIYGTALMNQPRILEYSSSGVLGNWTGEIGEEIYAICSTYDKLYVGATDRGVIYVFDENESIEDTLKLGLEAIKPILYVNAGRPLMYTFVIQDICVESGYLWVAIGNRAVLGNGGEIWKVNLETKEVHVVEVDYAIHSIAVYQDYLYMSATSIDYNEDNVNIAEETCIYKADIQ
jgi:hypothetical protein